MCKKKKQTFLLIIAIVHKVIGPTINRRQRLKFWDNNSICPARKKWGPFYVFAYTEMANWPFIFISAETMRYIELGWS